ncbi:sugar nucleotide-binding protein [Sporosarcina sp. YIM B06819]|uniref:sugar nucleotide-binding protein n=1 Tax=Sporosarcina sp. YIM B06819 TaxID=3081769 RepID=UPI00298C96FA|nr:sugar nucleotide-binding protein [Sporosarcina sp. YIM B06819]
MKKLLILGASGLVGKAIAKECAKNFDVYGTYFSTKTDLAEVKQFQLSVQDEGAIREILQVVQPDIIISSLRGDFDEQLTFHQNLTEAIKNKATMLYYFSTTNVFDGDLSMHHSESDAPIANSDYGRFKMNCENMLMQSLGNRSAIIRIPGIWGKNSPRMNSLKNNLETAEPIEAYSNLECSFLSDVQLARQVCFIFENELSGIFHLAAVDMVKECTFIEELAGQLTTGDINMQCNTYQDKETTYYFGLVSNREDLPEDLNITNKEIISYLVE